MSHTQKYVVQYHLDCHIAKCDWQICGARFVIMNLMTFTDMTPVQLKVDEYFFFIHITYVASGYRCTLNLQVTIDWSPLAHHSHNSTHGIYHTIYLPQKLPMSCINSFLSHMVIHNKQERQWNPTPAISNSTYNNSNVTTLINFNIEERKDWSIQYSLPYKRPFSLFVSVKKIMLLECLKRHSLMKYLTL